MFSSSPPEESNTKIWAYRKKKYTYVFHSVIDYVITDANDNDDKKFDQVTGIAYTHQQQCHYFC